MSARSSFGGWRIPTQAAIAAAVLLAAADAHGYPISPVTLWELTEQADLVVWAEVEESGFRPGYDPEDDDDWFDSQARLRVLETWKGPQRERVAVRFTANLICPAPAVYLAGERVLAFLERGRGGWTTIGLSYGSLYPRGAEVDDYRDLVRWAIRLQRGPRAVRDGEHLEWLVEAAARPGTRWHGLYELHPVADWVHASYDQSARPAGERRLPRHHLQRIAEGFVAAPPTDGTLPMALAVLAGWEGEDVDRAATSVIEALVAADRSPYWLRESLGLLFLRLGDPDPAARVAALGEEYGPIDPERLRDEWERARAELPIPEVAPAELPEDVVWGVSGSTPD
jgi:hypothetical protein